MLDIEKHIIKTGSNSVLLKVYVSDKDNHMLFHIIIMDNII